MNVEYLFIIGFMLSLLSFIYAIGMQIIKNNTNMPILKSIISIVIIFLSLLNAYYVYKGILIISNSSILSIFIAFFVQIIIAWAFIRLSNLKSNINILHTILLLILSLTISLLSVYSYSYSKKIVYKEIDKTKLSSANIQLLGNLNKINNNLYELLSKKEQLKSLMDREEKGMGNRLPGKGEEWKKLKLMYNKASIEYHIVKNYYNKISYDHEKFRNVLRNNTNPYETYILALKINDKLNKDDKSFSLNRINIKPAISSLFEGTFNFEIIKYTLRNWLFTLISIILGLLLFFNYRDKST